MSELTFSQREQLCTGQGFFADEAFPNLEFFRLAWRTHKATLLPELIAERPGERPLAWWIFEHGHERPVISRRPIGDGLRASVTFFGYLHSHLIGADGPYQELEVDYLDRLDLLTDAERQILRRGGRSRAEGDSSSEANKV
jgi:hypothetical protein